MFSIYLLINQVANGYKKSIIHDYSIVVISNTPMVKIDQIAGMKIRSIEPISRQKIINSVKTNLSDTSMELLNKRLPYFYKIYLTQFPTTFKLAQIKKELTSITSIKRVETFSKNHNQIYAMITLIQAIVFILFLVVLILSMLLLSKQVKIWFYEHKERISIIQLHGGTLLYSSIPIIKTIITSALVSSVFVYVILYFVTINLSTILPPELAIIIPKNINLSFEIIKIVALAFLMPILTFVGLLIQYKMK
jgi:cell division transport system permease protein